MSKYSQQSQTITNSNDRAQDPGRGYYHTMVDRTDECYPEYPPPYSPPQYNDPDPSTSKINSPIIDTSAAEEDSTKMFDMEDNETADAEDSEDAQVDEAVGAADGDKDGGNSDGNSDGGDDGNNDGDGDGNGNSNGDGDDNTNKPLVRHPYRAHRRCCTFPGEEQTCEIYFDLTHRSAWFNEDKVCPICLDNIKPNEETLTHKCQVEFHEDCLTKWLAGQVPQYTADGMVERPRGCPNCRGKILPREWVPWFNNQIDQRGGIIRALALTITRSVEALKYKDARHEMVVDRLRRANEKNADLELDLKFERRDHQAIRKRFEDLANLLNLAYRRNLLQVNTNVLPMNVGGRVVEDDHEHEEDEYKDDHEEEEEEENTEDNDES